MHEHWTIEWMVYAFDQCTIYIYVQIFRFSRDLYCMRIFSGIILYFCSFYFACIHSIRHLCVCANKSLRNSIPKKNHRNTQGKTKGKYFTHLCFCERVSFSFWVQTSLISLFVPLKKWQFLKVCASFRMKNFSFRFGAMIWNMFFFLYHLNTLQKRDPKSMAFSNDELDRKNPYTDSICTLIQSYILLYFMNIFE